MPAHASSPSWTTASFGNSVDMSAGELAALQRHLSACRALSGPMFAVRCVGDALHRFLLGRFVTTIVGVTLLAGLAALALS